MSALKWVLVVSVFLFILNTIRIVQPTEARWTFDPSTPGVCDLPRRMLCGDCGVVPTGYSYPPPTESPGKWCTAGQYLVHNLSGGYLTFSCQIVPTGYRKTSDGCDYEIAPTAPPVTAPPTPLPQETPLPPPPAGSNPTYTVRGVVFVDSNGDTFQNPGEQCYNGNVNVSLSNGASTNYSQDTGCTNRYIFQGLPAGSYTITISAIPTYVFSVNRTVNFNIP